jgi:2-oxoglutarate dehydrogenase E2 component (dihydrolipoamide succinyltransferase)
MGDGVEELTIVNWLKKEGDPVKEFEVIVELETDKVTSEIPSPADGTLLKIVAQKDTTVKVGTVMAWIGQPGEAIEGLQKEEKAASARSVQAAATAPAVSSAAVPVSQEAPVPAPIEPAKTEYQGPVSPLVKKLVELNAIDLNLVHGTGQDGRITKEDVQIYLDTRKTAPAVPTAAAVPAASVPVHAAAGNLPELEGELVPLSSLRRQIAERMVNSQHTSPHVLTVMEADLSKVLAHRAANKEAFAALGINLTLTAYFCAAIVAGLKARPDVNVSWTDEGIQRYNVINLGLAVSLGDAGLIVPVIKNAGALSLQGLAQQINDLSGRARSKKLLPDEVKGGTFTLTNHGTGGSLFASPIIMQPQAGILGTGTMQKRAVVLTDAAGNDSIAIRSMIYLSFVFDHRILDGEGADRFLKVVKETLENWQ